MIILSVLKAMDKLKYRLIRILQIIAVLRLEIRDVVYRHYGIVWRWNAKIQVKIANK
jgi:hypothetical protein